MDNLKNVQPVAGTSAGTWWQSGNGLLNDALNIWGKVEEIKATRAGSGNETLIKQLQPDLENGAAIQIDTMTTPEAKKQDDKILGMKPKDLLVLSVLVLGVGIALKKAGFN